jgi:FixJ family two-component response regulator
MKPMISIIDDDESVREATQSLVRSLGYLAATFSSAEEYLDSDCVDDTSCIITDVQMPGLSGIDLQHRLTAQGYGLPVIVVTAFPSETIGRRAIAAGAVAFLTKPFSDDLLRSCLETALKRGKSRSNPSMFCSRNDPA